jgi:hypothetical protein
MTQLLSPFTAEVRADLYAARGRGGMTHYDEKTRTLRFLGGDGERVSCYSISNVSEAAAVAVALEFKRVTVWSFDAFSSAVKSALGGVLNPVN